MKLSELIKEMSSFIEEHGDRDVWSIDSDGCITPVEGELKLDDDGDVQLS